MKEIEKETIDMLRKGYSTSEIVQKLMTKYSLNQNAAKYKVHAASKKLEDLKEAKDKYMWHFLGGIFLLLISFSGFIMMADNNNYIETMQNSNIPYGIRKYTYYPLITMPLSIYYFYKSYQQFRWSKEEDAWLRENNQAIEGVN
jgi:hypothetical protein